MLGQLDLSLEPNTTSGEAQSPSKKELPNINVTNEATLSVRSLSSDTLAHQGFRCEWNACGTAYETLRELVLHVHNHINAISK